MSKLITLKMYIPVKLIKTSDYQLTMLPAALPSDPLMEHKGPPFYSISRLLVYVCHMTCDAISYCDVINDIISGYHCRWMKFPAIYNETGFY